MASKGSISGSIAGGECTLRMDWTQTQNVTRNTSTLNLFVYLVCNNYLYVPERASNTICVGMTAVSFTSSVVNRAGETLLGWTSVAVDHEEDGSKTVSLSVAYNIDKKINGTNYMSIVVLGDVTLDSINRASTVTATNTDLGSTSNIRIESVSENFTHSLYYTFGTETGTIIENTTGTAIGWRPSLLLANQIPNATGGLCTINCLTFYNGTYIGTSTTTLRLSVPSNIKPSITDVSVVRINGEVPDSWDIYVQMKSKCRVTIESCTALYGAQITSYSITGGGYAGTERSLTTGFLYNWGVNAFTAKVFDSRGRASDTFTVSIYVEPYSPPQFLSYSSTRCNPAGDLSDTGTYVSGEVDYMFYGLNDKNRLIRSVAFRPVGSTTWIDGNRSFMPHTRFVFGPISTDTSYEIQYTLKDTFGAFFVTDTVSTAGVVMDFKSGGHGVAVGKVSETDNCFEVSENWEVRVYGQTLSEYIKSEGCKSYFGTCDTSASVAQKVVVCDDFCLEKGVILAVQFTNTNMAASPSLNVNGTGMRSVFQYYLYQPKTYGWFGGEIVMFVYNGTAWCMIGKAAASTTNYGVVKLSSSTSSTSTDLAATPSAVKAAYDRCSWDQIYLTNPLTVPNGGTGASTTAEARDNLGIGTTCLFNGTVTTGSLIFTDRYSTYIFIGRPTSGSERKTLIIPSKHITTSTSYYEFTGETAYYVFSLLRSENSITACYSSRSSNGVLESIYGVN